MSNTFNLGKPIGEHVSSLPQGEHGAGVGLAGGHGTANASNTQSGQFAESERSGFNHGLGGEHASGGIPSSGQSAHPIADKFTSGGAGVGAGSGLDNKLDNFSGSAAPRGDAVSGSYAGDGTSDALTGQSHAERTGAGVGPLGENLGAGALAGGAAGGAAGLATAKSGVDTKGVDPSTQYGTGVGASGGSGGHYATDSSSTTGQHGHSGAAAAAGLGAGAAGAGAAGASGAQGHFGTQETDFDRGAPVSDPKELDSGGRHGLVFDEKSGKYLHRHEIEESK